MRIPSTMDDSTVTALYHHLIAAWNKRDARAFAALFDLEGHVVGFDGSLMHGRAEIQSTLEQIFADHMTGRYVAKVRGVRFLSPDTAILRAVSGIVPAGQSDLNPATNAIQSLVAAKLNGQWRIVHYQNTPAQFHGRPELVEALSSELRELLPQ